MAHPIFTFINPTNQKRYFQQWDTITGYPETIPLDLLTFLQYKGLYYKDYIGTVFSVYTHLIENGSTIPGSIFPDPNTQQNPFFLQALLVLCDLENDPSSKNDDLNKSLEDLFVLDIDFSDFYSQYLNLISTIDEHPKRQLNYYISFAQTAICLAKSGAKIVPFVNQVFDEYRLHSHFNENENRKYDFDAWFKNGLFFKHQDAMAKLFVLLGKNNLIAIDAIPHLLRKNEEVVALFHLFGMQSLLPETKIQSDNKPRVFQLETFDSSDFLKEYVNHVSFHPLGDSSLVGLQILELTDDELYERLNGVYLGVGRLVNFVDENGLRLLPMTYSSYFSIDKDDTLHALAPLGLQQYHVFSNNGRLIDKTGYYDVCKVSNSAFYFQHMDLLSWQRIVYNSDLRISRSDAVNLDYNFEDPLVAFLDIELSFAQYIQEENQEVLNQRFMKREIIAPGEINHNNNEAGELPF
jgi:hypothetical protein